MAPPGSYYMPTIQLPDNAPPHHLPPGHPPGPPQPPGVSAEWIGPPAGQQPAGYATPFGQPMGLSPSWAPAGMATPFAAYGAYAPQLPQTNPPAAPGQYGPPPGPPPGPPGHGYAGPYATPAPQFAIPPGYQMAYATPAWGHTPMAFAAAPGPPPPAAPPRPPERLTRAERFDKVEPFAAGPHCMRRAYLRDEICDSFLATYTYRWSRARTGAGEGCWSDTKDQPLFAPSR